jgi:plastocyanin
VKKLIASGTAAAVAAGVLAIPAFAATKTIAVKDNLFAPKTTTVSKGTKVKFVWKGKQPHNVKVKKGPQKFASPVKTSGSFTRTVKKAGTYRIVCDIHPGMEMTLKVK